ncbi:MAG: succinate dehydrogenase assembly factor 2 [Methylotenera sp.]|nr:succinate dehydrogenase assembly factor 2 [Methylotenera sp.]
MTDEQVRRLSWRCRRGLLELDIVLQRFSSTYLAGLSPTELLALDALLDLPDNEFLDVVTLRLSTGKVSALQAKNLDGQALQSVLTKLSARDQNEG